ncbi:MarR family winged helix-turn-helix transcriptional regulator [Sinisalibacter aestuarii]|uniref:HTH marR-type domain-containing protein n=1 Tax=Sinisalibacter aestuarii TaxID=2949426 RepID=A0ABQ5LZD2_9RHOB|nr:MarR family transcriptional regulator [Sinisalibacter aestuarii]GKY89636.1 hypothetical protein STA1M1_35050 [Sinisalibacter aestuarii]
MAKQDKAQACPWSDLDPSGANLVVHDFLTTRLSALMSSLRRQVTLPYAKSFDLSIAQWRVLSLVAHAGTLPFGELVVQSTSDKALVSRTVRTLEERGLVTIQPETKASKKKIACTITPAGLTLYDEAIKIARKRQADMILSLNRGEREALFAIIEKLQGILDDE